MEIRIIGIIFALIVIYLSVLIFLNIKKIKRLAENERLEDLVKRVPENKKICEEMLKIVGNKKTKIKESDDNKTNLYIIGTDTILISKQTEGFTRIQTIAHECIHSIQSKYLQWFHFFFSIFWNILYAIVIIMSIQGKIENPIWTLCICLLCSFLYYAVRSYLEMEAMLKAKPIARQYLQNIEEMPETQIIEIIEVYEKLNNMGVKTTNYNLFQKELVKLFFYCIIVMIK